MPDASSPQPSYASAVVSAVAVAGYPAYKISKILLIADSLNEPHG